MAYLDAVVFVSKCENLVFLQEDLSWHFFAQLCTFSEQGKSLLYSRSSSTSAQEQGISSLGLIASLHHALRPRSPHSTYYIHRLAIVNCYGLRSSCRPLNNLHPVSALDLRNRSTVCSSSKSFPGGNRRGGREKTGATGGASTKEERSSEVSSTLFAGGKKVSYSYGGYGGF